MPNSFPWMYAVKTRSRHCDGPSMMGLLTKSLLTQRGAARELDRRRFTPPMAFISSMDGPGDSRAMVGEQKWGKRSSLRFGSLSGWRHCKISLRQWILLVDSTISDQTVALHHSGLVPRESAAQRRGEARSANPTYGQGVGLPAHLNRQRNEGCEIKRWGRQVLALSCAAVLGRAATTRGVPNVTVRFRSLLCRSERPDSIFQATDSHDLTCQSLPEYFVADRDHDFFLRTGYRRVQQLSSQDAIHRLR